MDGILDLGTSALEQPYVTSPALETEGSRGFEYFEQQILYDYVRELEAVGFQVHFHATGDRAVAIALDAVAAARKANTIADRRHRITHLYLVGDSDRARFKELGVVADLQASPDAVDPDYANSLIPFLGAGRASALLPMNSLAAAGARVTLSSDWDAGPLPPFGTIERALSRPTEAIADRATAIRMHTLDAAHLLHLENVAGSIENGKRADLIVLDQNPFEVLISRVGETKVLLTLVDGETVFSSGDVTAACTPSGTSTCLGNSRFEARVAYRDFESLVRNGQGLRK